jgi:aminopeptidase N
MSFPTRHRISAHIFRRAPLTGTMFACTALAACAVADDAPAEPDQASAEATAQSDLSSSSSSSSSPSPGAAGIGDPLFPTLGNGGYEVDHYDLALRYATSAPDQGIDGTATILAHATQALSRFNLDFAGDSVGAVTVDGRPAAASWDGEELVVTPARALRRGQPFLVAVHHFTASTKVPDPRVLLGAPFFSSPDGSAWAAQPHNAHTIFPSNDHPSDKATFSFRIDVPAGTTAVANGERLGQATFNGRTVFAYLQLQPMATELAQVATGAFTVTDRGTHAGVRVRDVTPTRLTAGLEPKLAIELDHLASLQAQLGDYPFGTYGSLVVDSPLGFALETQTLSLYAAFFFDDPIERYAPLMVHELAHQWFGNSVAPAKWSDVWQSEGHATWYELSSQFPLDSAQHTALMRRIYSFGELFRVVFGPVAAPRSGDVYDLFNPNVYFGGALALYALRQEVGDATFQQIERTWVSRYRGRSPSTQDFIALSSELAGRDLSAFLQAWFYDETTPPMPGHPDWTVTPFPPPAPGAPGSSGASGASGFADPMAAARAQIAADPLFAQHRRH